MISVNHSNGLKAMEWLLTLERGKRLRLNIEEKLPTADHVKPLGAVIYRKLKFNKHIETLHSNVSKKVTAFARLN